MTISNLPLCYCTNVHPGRSVQQILDGLDQYAVKVRDLSPGTPLAVGLWFAHNVATEILSDPQGPTNLARALQSRNLTCYTLNAFPYGDFHKNVVKQDVYLPDWASPDRAQYTQDCADILAHLLPENTEGSISTLPLGFKQCDYSHEFQQHAIQNLLTVAKHLRHIHETQNRLIRLAIEPEPFCLVETTPEAVDFFSQLYQAAEQSELLDIAKRHLGLCYDVCHQAVEFEDPQWALDQLSAADIRINKVQISCAIQTTNIAPGAPHTAALHDYVDTRYLHQTFAQLPDGQIINTPDLTADLLNTPAQFQNASLTRIHYHVPVNADSIGSLQTTRNELKKALAAIASLPYAPHLEIETYTWEVLPNQSLDLAQGLHLELTATQSLLDQLN